jgi:hypothetical protein
MTACSSYTAANHCYSVAEYMAFIRGIIVMVIQMYKSRVDFMFNHLFEQDQDQLLKPHIDKVTLPQGMWQWKAGALASLAGLRSLCLGDELRTKYLQLTENMAHGLEEESPYKGSPQFPLQFLSAVDVYTDLLSRAQSIQSHGRPLLLVAHDAAKRLRQDSGSQ